MRWAESLGRDVSARADLSSFPDAANVSDWATSAFAWAVSADVIEGVQQPDGSYLLTPKGTASRAEAAAIMMRLLA